MNNIIFTKAMVFRNLKDYKFVPKLEEEKKGEIVDKLSSALKGKLSALNPSTANEKVIPTRFASPIKLPSLCPRFEFIKR